VAERQGPHRQAGGGLPAGPAAAQQQQRRLYLIRGTRPLLLFETHPDKDGTIVVSPKTDNLAIFQITPKLTDAWITDATKAAARLAPR
jgi:diadenosine tetraphosphate (Ap4A) HIT family hydrolase